MRYQQLEDEVKGAYTTMISLIIVPEEPIDGKCGNTFATKFENVLRLYLLRLFSL